MNPWQWLVGVALPLYLLDQATKAATIAWIPLHETIEILPGFFNLVHVTNTGAAFGMLKDQNLFFTVLSSAALLALGVLWWRGAFGSTGAKLAVSLLFAGIAGNLTDRLIHGHVIDFADVILPWYGHWPAFNIADSCICVAAGILVIQSIFPTWLAAERGERNPA